MRRTALLLVASLLAESALGSVALAQTGQAASGSSGAGRAQALDVDKLPVSVVRVQRQLETLPPYDPSGGLRLNFFVDVYGKSPRLDLFTGIDLSGKGAVQYGPMTHAEFLQFVTPKPFRAPVMDLGSIMFAAAGWASRRSAERRQQAEQRRVEAEAQRLRESR